MENKTVFEKNTQILELKEKGNRSSWSKGLTAETDERLKKAGIKKGETRKKLFKEGKLKPSSSCFKKGHIAWSKGLTKETDERLKKSSITQSSARQIGLKNGTIKIWNKGLTNEEDLRILGKESHPNWKGGISKETYDLNWTRKFKRAARKRDNQICMLCNIHREKLTRALDIHHINYNKKMSIPQNCISLCIKCHLKTNFNRDIWTKHFQSLLTRLYGYQYSEGKEIILELNSQEVLNI